MTIELPGLFDLQVNGFAGVDFNGADLTVDRAAEALDRLRGTGVTRVLPTLITSSFERFAANAGVLGGMTDEAIAGLHMEGPYISSHDGPRGAHPREHVRTGTIDDFKRRQDAACGRIALVTLAPEVPGVLPLIEHLAASGVHIAIGHTAASPAQISEAIHAGARLATHLGNGCAQMLPRHPNVIWELLAADAVCASLVVDGHHLPPATVKAMVRAKGLRRTLLVTDATAAAASPPGRYRLGGLECEVDDRARVELAGTPYLAGSALTMPRAIANTVRFTGLPLDDVVPMASTIPASCLGTTTAGRVTAEWDAEAGELLIRSVNT